MATTLTTITGSSVSARFLMAGERFHAPVSNAVVWAGQLLEVTEHSSSYLLDGVQRVIINARTLEGHVVGLHVYGDTMVQLESELVAL